VERSPDRSSQCCGYRRICRQTLQGCASIVFFWWTTSPLTILGKLRACDAAKVDTMLVTVLRDELWRAVDDGSLRRMDQFSSSSELRCYLWRMDGRCLAALRCQWRLGMRVLLHWKRCRERPGEAHGRPSDVPRLEQHGEPAPARSERHGGVRAWLGPLGVPPPSPVDTLGIVALHPSLYRVPGRRRLGERVPSPVPPSSPRASPSSVGSMLAGR
jgi:hypothetical protein